MKKLLDEQYKKYNTPSKNSLPILSMKNFDIYDNGTIRVKSIKPAEPLKVPEGKVPAAELPKTDTKWFVLRKSKRFGPFTKRQLIELYKSKKISKNEKLLGNESNESTMMKILFAPKPKNKVEDPTSMKVLKFSVAMALSDGHLDQTELASLNHYCEENNLSKNLLNETIQFLNKEGPPPVTMIEESFTKDDFMIFVEMAKSDGDISSSELRLLQKLLRDMRKKYPEMKEIKLKDYLKQAL